MKKKFAIAAACALLLPASFLLDGKAAIAINSIRSESLTLAIDTFNRHYFWIYLALVIATAFFALRERRDTGRRLAIMIAAILATVASTHLLKPLIHRGRPDGIPFLDPIFGTTDYSFPSGHTSSAAAAAFAAPALKIPWLIFVAATVFSRLYSNAHFLSDTTGGIILAAIIAMIIKRSFKKKLDGEDKLEIKRQALHAAIGLAIALFAWKYSFAGYALVAAAAAGILLSYVIRWSAAAKNEAAKKLRNLTVAALRKIERKDELQRFPGKGAIMLFIGAGITAAVFKREAAAAIAILAVGDSVSHLAGRLIGKTRHKRIFAKNKTIEGSVYGFAFASAAAALMVPVWIAVASAAAAMLVEAINMKIMGKKIDDNITVPLAAAIVIWAARLVL